MKQCVYAGLQLYECAVVLDLYYFAFDNLSNLIVFVDHAPWLWLILLETQRNLSFFCVHGKNLYVDLLTNAQNFLRVLQLAPGDLGNVKQTINAADVNKRTVICKSHYSTFHYIVYIQVFPDFCNQLILFFIQEQLVREYCSVSSLVNSGNSDFHSLSYEFFCIFNVVIRKL